MVIQGNIQHLGGWVIKPDDPGILNVPNLKLFGASDIRDIQVTPFVYGKLVDATRGGYAIKMVVSEKRIHAVGFNQEKYIDKIPYFSSYSALLFTLCLLSGAASLGSSTQWTPWLVVLTTASLIGGLYFNIRKEWKLNREIANI